MARLKLIFATTLMLTIINPFAPHPLNAQAADTLDSLEEELKIPVLSPVIRQALDFLVANSSPHIGLNTVTAYATWKALSEQQTISFNLLGGPTQESILFTAQRLEDLPQLQKNVQSQQARDKYRPDFSAFKQILSERLPVLFEQLKSEQARSRQEILRLDNQQAQLSQRLTHLQTTISQLEIQSGNTQLRLQQYQQIYNQTHQSWQRVQTDFDNRSRSYRALNQQIATELAQQQKLEKERNQELGWAKQEEAMITRDPANAALHRQRSQHHYFRVSQLNQAITNLINSQRQLKQNSDQQRYALNQLELQVRDWKNRLDADLLPVTQTQAELSNLQIQLTEHHAQSGQTQTELTHTQQQLTRQQGLQAYYVNGLSGVDKLQQSSQILKDYPAYSNQKTQLLGLFTQTAQLAANSDYQLLNGSGLSEKLRPLLSLFRNMDKPPLP